MEDDGDWAQGVVATAHSNLSLLRRSFSLWRNHVQQNRARAQQFTQWKLAHIKNTLSHLHNSRLLRSAFHTWRAFIRSQRLHILRRALKTWTAFLAFHREQQAKLDQAISFWTDRQLFRAFYPWRKAARISARRKKRLHWAFMRWREEVAVRKRLRRSGKLAQLFRYKVLLGGSFYTWKGVIMDRVRREKMQLEAVRFDGMRRKRACMKEWMRHVQTMQQRRDRHINALQLWSRKLQRRCFLAWVQFTAWRIRHRDDMRAAAEHHELRQKSQAVVALASNAARRRKAQRDMLAAAAFWEDRLKHAALLHMHAYAEARTRTSLLTSRALQFYQSSLVKNCWQKLVSFCDFSRERMRKISVKVDEFMVKRADTQLKFWLQKWIDWHQTKLVSRLNVLRAEAIFHRRLKSRVFHAWRAWSFSSRAERMVKRHVLYLFARSRLKKTFFAWKEAWIEIKERRTKAEELYALRCEEVLRCAMADWKSFLVQVRARRKREEFAMEWRRKELVKSGVRVWMRNAMQHKMQKEAMLQQESALKATLVMKRVAKYAQHWRRVTLQRKMQRDGGTGFHEPQPSSSLMMPESLAHTVPKLGERQTAQQFEWMQPRSKPRPKPRPFLAEEEELENLISSMNR